MKKIWQYVVNWFEYGDLVPLLVLVSAVHYAAVLQDKDQPVVAVAIGLLVDLGHFRTIRAAVRYSGESKRQAFARWLIAAGMTALSLNYHQRYYADWWLSAPLPLLIAALAWLQRVDQRAGSKPRAEPSEAKPTTSQPSPLHVCSCGYVAKSKQALNAHQRAHRAPVPLNGKVKEAASDRS